MLAGEVVLVPTPAGVVAYGLVDGRARWTAAGAAPAAVAADPDGPVVVFEERDRMQGRRAATGEVLWTRIGTGRAVQSLEQAGLVVLTDDAARPDDGCGTQRTPCEVAGPPTGPPEPGSGRAALLDPSTGEPRWTVPLPGRPDTYASAVGTGHVYVSYQGPSPRLRALDLPTGRWSWDLPVEGGRVTVSGDVPAVLGTTAAALDPSTGARLWRADGEGPFRDAAFVGVDGRQGLARDPQTGLERPGRVPVTYALVVAADLLVGVDDSVLTAVRVGSVVWTARLVAGPRPGTLLDADADASWVVSVTGVGLPPTRD